MKLKGAGETVEEAWRLAYGRGPDAREREAAVGFLERRGTGESGDVAVSKNTGNGVPLPVAPNTENAGACEH